jgi:hypothetical protein
VPPAGIAVMVPLSSPKQLIFVEETVTLKSVGSFRKISVVSIQPLSSVAITT